MTRDATRNLLKGAEHARDLLANARVQGRRVDEIGDKHSWLP